MEQIDSKQKPKPSRWGWGIAALYTGFALFAVGLAVVASMQDVSLVESDYYQKGLDHQKRIDEEGRAAALSADVRVEYDATLQALAVYFPPECATEPIASTVHLYRPSNARWDQHFQTEATQAGKRLLHLERPVPGLWKLKVEWIWRGESYYSKAEFVISS